MILYHGSNIKVDKPRIIESKRALDFGFGFYLTSDYSQAQKWAIRKKNFMDKGIATVSVFSLNENQLDKLAVLKFDSPNKEWLHYVAANRKRIDLKLEYDIVIGPVADDQTVNVLNQYLSGFFPEEIAIQLLLPQNLKDQFVFKTEKSLKILEFKEAKLL